MEDLSNINSNGIGQGGNDVPVSTSTPPTPVTPSDATFNPSGTFSEDLDSMWLRWKCLVCGHVYEGVTPLKVCPKCGNSDVDKFDDVE